MENHVHVVATASTTEREQVLGLAITDLARILAGSTLLADAARPDSLPREAVRPATVHVVHAAATPVESALLPALRAYATEHPDAVFSLDLFEHPAAVAAKELLLRAEVPPDATESQRDAVLAEVASRAWIPYPSHIAQIGTLVVVLSPWNAPLILQDPRCMWEMLAASPESGSGLQFVVPPEEVPALTAAIEADLPGLLRLLSEQVNADRAASSDSVRAENKGYPASLMWSRMVQRTCGFGALDTIVKHRIVSWVLDLAAAAAQPSSFLTLADAMAEHGDVQRARNFYAQALLHAEAQPLAVATVHCKLAKLARDNDEPAASLGHVASARQVLASSCASSEANALLGELDDLEGEALLLLGNLEAALALRQSAVERLAQTHGADALPVAKAVVFLATTELEAGLVDEGLRHFEQALLVLDREPADGGDPDAAAGALLRVGAVHIAKKDVKAAVAALQKALSTGAAAHGPVSAETASLLSHIAGIFADIRALPMAKEFYERCALIREKVFGPRHPSTAEACHNAGVLAVSLGQAAQSVEWHMRALQARMVALGETDPLAMTSLQCLALSLAAAEDHELAAEQYQRLLKLRYATTVAPDEHVAAAHNDLAKQLFLLGRLDLARQHYLEALSIKQTLFGNDHPSTAATQFNLGVLLRNSGELVGALEYFKTALKTQEQHLGPEHAQTATTLSFIGELEVALGEAPSGLDSLQRAVSAREKSLGSAHPQTAMALLSLGRAQAVQGDVAAAVASLEKSLPVFEEALGSTHDDIGILSQEIGRLHLKPGGGGPARALPHLQRVLTIARKTKGAAHADAQEALRDVGQAMRQLREADAAPAASASASASPSSSSKVSWFWSPYVVVGAVAASAAALFWIRKQRQ